MATTRVQIIPQEGGPNDNIALHSQTGVSRNRKFSGTGSDTDIITSSARAYTSALNKLLTWNARRKEQEAKGEESESTEGGVGNAQPVGSPKVVVADKLQDPST